MCHRGKGVSDGDASGNDALHSRRYSSRRHADHPRRVPGRGDRDGRVGDGGAGPGPRHSPTHPPAAGAAERRSGRGVASLLEPTTVSPLGHQGQLSLEPTLP